MVSTITKPQSRLEIGPGKLAKLQSRKELLQASGYFFLLSVVVMFLLDGGLENLNSVTAILDAFSRLTSLVGTALLLIMLLLTARIPWIDAQFGQDVATHTHKRLGKPAFYLILAHFVATLISYSLSDGKDLLAELWYLMQTFEDLTKAVIAMAVMVLVVVTSFNFARKKVKYETWFLVHLLSYISVLFSIPHIFQMGTDLVINQIHNAIWMFAYVFVGYNIVFFRIALPLWRSLAAGLVVKEIIRESSDSVSVYIAGKNLSRFGAKSGQFFQVRFLASGLWSQAHPFSISNVPDQNLIRFTIGDRGDATNSMQGLQPGTKVILSGPFGVFTEAKRTQRDVLLIAAGIGIPPVRSLAEGMVSTSGDISILYRTRSETDAPLLDEISEVSTLRGHNLQVVSGNRPGNGNWLSHYKTDEEELLQRFPKLWRSDVYLCGPIEFTSRVKQTLSNIGIKESAIHAEEYAW